MAAVLAQGTTVIDNAAREPEIVDICAMLTAMGAQIYGAGTSTLHIEGVDGCGRSPPTVGDRIVAGTWAFGAAMTRGDVTVRGVEPAFLEIALDKLVTAGGAGGDPGRRVPGADGRPAEAVDVVTLPFPGFATDLLPMAIGLAAVSDGLLADHREHLRRPVHVRQGADPARRGYPHRWAPRGGPGPGAALRRPGPRHRHPGRSRAGHRRAVRGRRDRGCHVHHIDRGYPDFVADLRALGVEVERGIRRRRRRQATCRRDLLQPVAGRRGTAGSGAAG